MSERLSDEQVARATQNGRGLIVTRGLAREVQATRLLLNGGPCPTCGGTGKVRNLHTPTTWPNPDCPNPDCIDGHRPGVIERLEAAMDNLGLDGFTDATGAEFAAVIAELKEALDE